MFSIFRAGEPPGAKTGAIKLHKSATFEKRRSARARASVLHPAFDKSVLARRGALSWRRKVKYVRLPRYIADSTTPAPLLGGPRGSTLNVQRGRAWYLSFSVLSLLVFESVSRVIRIMRGDTSAGPALAKYPPERYYRASNCTVNICKKDANLSLVARTICISDDGCLL